MLSVVDRFAESGIGPLGRAAAPLGAGLEQRNVHAVVDKGHGGRDSRVPPSDDRARRGHRDDASQRWSAPSSEGTRTRSR